MAENTNSNENTFWNFFLLIVVILIIWYVFFNQKERFTSNQQNPQAQSKKLSQENKMKIIQKINNTASAMSYNDNLSLKPLLNQYSDYADIQDTPQSQYAMTLGQDDKQSEPVLQSQTQGQDDMYPNLGSTKAFSSKDLSFKSSAGNGGNTNKTADGSTKLMNQVGFLDGEKVSCNMLGVDTANMDSYKKKFYSMYAHQIECPSKCGMKANGMSKGCGMGSMCGLEKGCSNINSDTSIPDTFALNYLALDNANKKPCVTCNFKPRTNPLNREWMERDYPSYDGLPEDVKIADEARMKKMGLIDANVSNYANFKNNVYQDSIGETAPDRINEIRACQDANGTCGLKDYGSSIATAYDKLIANPSYTSRNNCDPYQLSGVLEDSAPTDMYANVLNQ
jgi:hypothetical protein